MSVGAQAIMDELKKHPDMPARTMARRLYARWPEMWKDIEACRGQIRYQLGQSGTIHKKQMSSTEFVRSPRKPGERAAIPHSYAKETPIFRFQESLIGVISDTQIPYHDLGAIEACIKDLRKRKLDALLLNGDVVDFYQVSKFGRDPRKPRMKEELDMLHEFLRYLRAKFSKIPIYYKLGNHEARMERYLMDKAPELLDVLEFRLSRLLPFQNLGISEIASLRVSAAGQLYIIHGHEYPTPVLGPVNAARGLFLRAGDCAIAGHHHQSSEHTKRTIGGTLIGTWSTGCLCGLSPEFAFLNNWCHGFAVVEVGKDGFQVDNRKIINGVVR